MVFWDDVTDPAVLLEKAKAYLTDLQFDNMALELKALDLHYLNVDHEAVNLLDEIRVISRPHGLDRMFPVTKLEIPLDSPDQTQFTMGNTVKTNLTSVNNQTSAAILQKIEALPKAHSLLKEAKENATAIMNMATTGYITITKGENGSEELIISNVRDYTKADKLWKWNMNGFGYSKDGGKTFGLAMTMDGSIVADYITSGVLNADVIRAGVLKDYGGNFSLDFTTGRLTMKKGSIALGEYTDGHYNFEVDNEGNLYARRGTFAGTLSGAKGTFGGELIAASGEFKGTLKAAKIYGDLVSDSSVGGWIRGCGISVGGTNWQNGIGNFYVDSNGNVTMAGSIRMSGNITWSTTNSPCQALYAYAALSTPYGQYSDFPNYSSYRWHRVFDDWNDYYASYTYDGGNTWTAPIKIRGTDGQNGADGRNGTDAEVTRYNLWLAMLSATPEDGIYSSYDYWNGRQALLIKASAIQTGAIDAELISLSSGYGGFCQGYGYDGVNYTYGAKMYGSVSSNYVIATNAGVRMTAGGNSIFTTAGGCYSNVEFARGSDRRIKNGITYDMEKYTPFFMNLKPTAFRLNKGTSNRFHIGFVAQDVEEAILASGISTEDFAGFVRSSGEGDTHDEYVDQCYLRYDNFIALNTFMIQSALKQIESMKDELKKLQERSDTPDEYTHE